MDYYHVDSLIPQAVLEELKAESLSSNDHLYKAVSDGNLERASELLASEDTDVNFNCDSYSLLHLAVIRQDIAMVNLLIHHKVDLNPISTQTEPVMIISPLWKATMDNYVEIAELLIKSGANVNECTAPFHITFLHMATAMKDHRRINFLIDHGADVNLKNMYGKSALQYALIDPEYETVELLLKRGADVNVTDEEGTTALHQAASNGDTSMVLLLLQYGADVNRVDNLGSNALHYASASTGQHVEVTEILLKHGALVDGFNLSNLTPLHCAIAAEKLGMVRLLIEYGADLNAKSKTSGVFPLIISVQLGNSSITQLLLKSGVFVNDKTFDNKTALHQACILGSSELVYLLLDFGADVNIVNSEGNTPLSNVCVPDDVNDDDHDSNDFIATLLIKRIAALEDKINQVNLKLINDNARFSKHYNLFSNEIKKMREMKLSNNIVFTYHYIFTEKVEKLVPLARNEEFIKCYKSNDHLYEFPCYFNEIEEKFEKALHAANKIMKIEVMLTDILGGHLPLPFIQSVVKYMAVQD